MKKIFLIILLSLLIPNSSVYAEDEIPSFSSPFGNENDDTRNESNRFRDPTESSFSEDYDGRFGADEKLEPPETSPPASEENAAPQSILPDIIQPIDIHLKSESFIKEANKNGICYAIRNDITEEAKRKYRNSYISALLKFGCFSIVDLPILLIYIANFLMGIIGSITVLMLIYGGYQFVFSGFSDSGTKQATSTIQYALVGMIIAMFSWVIINFVLANLVL